MSDGQQRVTLTQKGRDGIMKASGSRGSGITVAVGQDVHVKCRSELTNSRSIQFHIKRKHSDEQEQHLPHRLGAEQSF